MTKKEMIQAIQDQIPFTQKEVDQFLNALSKVAQHQLTQGQPVVLPGLIKLTVANRAVRIGRNPQTGEVIHIPAKRVVKVKTLKALDDAIN